MESVFAEQLAIWTCIKGHFKAQAELQSAKLERASKIKIIKPIQVVSTN